MSNPLDKRCPNCKWCNHDGLGEYHKGTVNYPSRCYLEATCTHPSLVTVEYTPWLKEDHPSYILCRDCRTLDQNPCGIDGKLWEPINT
jgi:hypothetical protein